MTNLYSTQKTGKRLNNVNKMIFLRMHIIMDIIKLPSVQD